MLTATIALFTCATVLFPSEFSLTPMREASGFRNIDDGTAVMLSGDGFFQGVSSKARLIYGPDGRFRQTSQGELSLDLSYDGRCLWRKDYSTGPYELELGAREAGMLRAWVHSGFWLSADAPVEIQPAGDDMSLELRLKDGMLTARVSLDADTLLPREMMIPDGGNGLLTTFDDYRQCDGAWIAHKVVSQIGYGQALEYSLESSALLATEEGSFERQDPRTDFYLDPDADPTVEAKLSKKKRMYIRVDVDGEDLGYFLFDSGAGFSGISRRAAERLDLPTFGDSAITGLGGGVTPSRLRRAKTVQIGPLLIDDLVFTEIHDRSPVDNSLDGEVNGVIGWDLLSRVVVDVDTRAAYMTLHPFDDYELPVEASSKAKWLPITLHYEVPWVKARFTGDRDGLFMVDTGSNASVYFFAAATQRLGLLDGVEIAERSGVGAGGAFQTTIAPLDWFEIAGDGWKDDVAIFGLGDDGEDDPYTVGLLGGGLLRLYRLVFDYSQKRVAFIAR